MNKRNRYAFVGAAAMLFAGVIYAWSVLSEPIGREFSQVSTAKLSLIFTLCMICFCLGGIIAGFLQKRVPLKAILIAAAILFALGFIGSSRAKSISTLYVTYGLFAGMAAGLVYNTVLGAVISWFQDCQGLMSGILLMSFGFGSMFLGSVYAARTPEQIGAWRNTFVELGIALALICLLSAILLKKNPSQSETNAAIDGAKNINPLQMHTTSAFWLFFLWAILLSGSGLALISQARAFAQTIASGHSSRTIAFIVGLISIFNGIGRTFFGAVNDRIGREKTMSVITISFLISATILILAHLSVSYILMIIAFMATGFSYGGITPTNSAFVYSEYGNLYYSQNLSLVNLNLLFASFGSTLSGYLFDYSGSFLATFLAMQLAGILSLVIAYLLNRIKSIEPH